MTTLHEQALQIRADADRRIDAIRSNPQLSDAGKRIAMAPHVLNAKRQIAQMQEQANTYRVERAKELRRSTFGATGNAAMDIMSYRDAVSRASTISDPDAAMRQMTKSLEGGDLMMARALADTAADYGWSDVLGQYTEAVPEAGQAIQEITQLTPTIETAMTDGMHFRVDMPAELGRYTDSQLEHLATEGQALAQ